jgi:hypothetical protein
MGELCTLTLPSLQACSDYNCKQAVVNAAAEWQTGKVSMQSSYRRQKPEQTPRNRSDPRLLNPLVTRTCAFHALAALQTSRTQYCLKDRLHCFLNVSLTWLTSTSMLLSRAGGSGLLSARQQSSARPFSTGNHVRFVVAHARSRRPRTDAEQGVPEDEQQPEAVQQQPEIVRSSRGKASARRTARETRSTTQKLVTPHKVLREMGIIATDDKG